jgi:hypothetical protein
MMSRICTDPCRLGHHELVWSAVSRLQAAVKRMIAFFLTSVLDILVITDFRSNTLSRSATTLSELRAQLRFVGASLHGL